MELSKLGSRAVEITLNAVFPPRCAGCEIFSAQPFCDTCQRALLPLRRPWCRVCGSPFDPAALSAAICAACRPNRYHHQRPYLAARSSFFHEGPVRHAIHALKYRGKTVHVPALAAAMAATLGQEDDLEADFQIVVPIPLHPWRRWRRGFNQSELLARALGRQLALPAEDLLSRHRFTPPQVGLSRSERELNVQDSFTLRPAGPALIAGKTVLLVDDVLTTGATCAEAAAVLKAAGARDVVVVTLARES